MSYLSKMYDGPDELESKQNMLPKCRCWKNGCQLRITYIRSAESIYTIVKLVFKQHYLTLLNIFYTSNEKVSITFEF